MGTHRVFKTQVIRMPRLELIRLRQSLPIVFFRIPLQTPSRLEPIVNETWNKLLLIHALN
jgi:hypothetical protein